VSVLDLSLTGSEHAVSIAGSAISGVRSRTTR